MHKQSHQNTHPTFTYRKGRIFYFRRKIPSDLRCHYKRHVFVQSLRTASRLSAQKAATIISARLVEQWLMLRIKHNQSVVSQLLVDAERKSELPLISEILERYLETKGIGKAELFFVHAKRNIGYVISAIGDILKFTYREFTFYGYARDAFTQDVQYDLKEDPIIGFKGARVEVIEATNREITYKVISYFSD